MQRILFEGLLKVRESGNHEQDQRKSETTVWNQEHFRNLASKSKGLRDKLAYIQQRPPIWIFYRRNRKFVKKLDELLVMEDFFRHQRAKSQMLREGDRNTKFFHVSSAKQNRRNTILVVQNVGGVWMLKPE